MAAFLEDITPFYGNRERDQAGRTLEEFLEVYDPKKYEQPSVTVDILVVRCLAELKQVSTGLKLLMIQRGNHPSIGKWALPGGFIQMREDALDSARRELEEETGLKDIPMEQIRCWGEWNRDPRGRILTIAYLASVEEGQNPKAGDDAADAGFFDVIMIPISQEEEQGKQKRTFRIILKSEEKQVELSAVLCQTQNNTGLIRQKQLEILESDGFACDHAKIVADGILYIEELLKKQLKS